jgi:uncharacterized MAPEG superfamily protein
MTVDLWMLALSALWCLSIPMIGVAGLMRLAGGMAWGFSNRDEAFALPLWIERTRRAHTNMVENLAPFAAFVLIAHVTGKANATTALGAQLFLGGRIAHTIIYVAGIPVARTLVFFVATFGQLMILFELLR